MHDVVYKSFWSTLFRACILFPNSCALEELKKTYSCCDWLATCYPPISQLTASSMSNFLICPYTNGRESRFRMKLEFLCSWCHSHNHKHPSQVTHNLCRSIQSKPKSVVTVRSDCNGCLKECLPSWTPLCGPAAGCVNNIEVSLCHTGTDITASPLYIADSFPNEPKCLLAREFAAQKFRGKVQCWFLQVSRVKP